MDKVRIALIGCGYWGPNLLRNLYAHPQVDVAWACDLLDKNLEKVKRLYPILAVTKDIQQVREDRSVQAVVLAVPTRFHFSLAREMLLAGKHVLLEKPMTETVAQAEELVALAKKKRLALCVDHPFVFSESVKRIKSLIDEKALGKLFYINSTRANLGLIQPDINVIADLAPHDFSILDYILDKKLPTSYTTTGSMHVGKEQVECAHIHLRYDRGFCANIDLSWLSPLKMRQITVVGSKRMVVYDDTHASEKIRIYDKNVTIAQRKATPFQPFYRSGDILIPQLSVSEPLYQVVDAFLQSIRKEKVPNDGAAGLRVVKMLHDAQKALKQER